MSIVSADGPPPTVVVAVLVRSQERGDFPMVDAYVAGIDVVGRMKLIHDVHIYI